MNTLRRLLGACFKSGFIAITLTAHAETNAWQFQPALLPQAIVFEGLWNEYFQIVPALHSAGIPATRFTVNEMPATDPGLAQAAVIVLINVDAPSLGAPRLARIREFVAAGGGLVVLGGEYAFGRGGYANTLLAELLPVDLAGAGCQPPISRQGVTLARATGATWLPATDFAAKPQAFFLNHILPKTNAIVQLLAGNCPALVSGTFGKGRVVACALSVNGDPAPGVLTFWDWPDWPRLLGQTIEWAAGSRPLAVPAGARPGPASKVKPLTDDEVTEFSVGLKTPDNFVARATAYPSAAIAQALFTQIMGGDAPAKLSLPKVLPVLVPFAKADWGPHLVERTESLNPNLEERRAALILLGATRWPGALAHLVPALSQPETELAALEALGHSGNVAAIAPVEQIYAAALRAARLPDDPEWVNPTEFAHVQAGRATEAALALYRLGATTGVVHLLAMHRQVTLYWRIYHNAGRRSIKWDNPLAVKALQAIWEAGSHLTVSLEKLNRHTEPIPARQLAALLTAAQSATDPVDVDWLVAELQASLPAFPPATWQPLVSAKDGIIARLARRAVATNAATQP